jgi:hypothetical protein
MKLHDLIVSPYELEGIKMAIIEIEIDSVIELFILKLVGALDIASYMLVLGLTVSAKFGVYSSVLRRINTAW